ncbi:MAG: hypothetical protein KJ706_02530 [Candidatus Omnitrophica bacterium]|nr:hypothetical protein [Candidatus Omnitrophota bacterium]MBU4589784.1 hypothetical protein [Candidatus Omnitrophota bacterium]
MINKTSILDYLFLTLIVSVVTLQPHFMHGAINFYETGIYLPQISEFFHGKVFYRDMFVLRGPLEILMPAYLMKHFGMHIGVLNGYFYFGTILTLIIYAIFAARIFKTRAFAYLFTLVLVARTFPRVTFAIWGGIRFGFGILAILLAVNFLRARRTPWLFLAGLVTGLALWTSPDVGVFGIISIVAMLLCFAYFEEDMEFCLKHLLVYFTGVLIVSLPFILYLFLNNAFIPFVSTLKTTLIAHCRTDVFDPALCFETPRNFKEFLLAFSPTNHNFKYTLPTLLYVPVGIYLFFRIIKRNNTLFDIAMIPVFIYGLLLYKAAFRDIEGPQYRIALQPLLLLMFFYLERAYIYVKNIKSAAFLKKALVVLFIVLVPLYSVVFSLYKYNKRFFIFKEAKSLVAGRTHAAIPYAGLEPLAIESSRAKGVIVPGYQARDIDLAVEYIRLYTDERETVFTFPDLGAYNFLTDRPPLGRFYTAEFSFFHPAWFEEVMSDLKREKPRYVICATNFSRLEQFRPVLGMYLDEVEEYLDKNYEVTRSYSTIKILRILR